VDLAARWSELGVRDRLDMRQNRASSARLSWKPLDAGIHDGVGQGAELPAGDE